MAYTPERITAELRKAWGGNLLSAVLYGSGATDEFDPKRSDYNLLLVVRDSVKAGGPVTGGIFRKWSAEGNPTPLVMTADFMRRSADVFPLEWLDIRERHRVLFGKDPVAGLKVGGSNYRLELERELKSNLLRLQGKYRMLAGRNHEVRELITMSSSTFIALFRACLRLLGARPLPARSGTAAALARKLGFDASPFGFAARLRNGERDALKADPDLWMGKYMRAIMAVVAKVENTNRRIAKR